MIYGGNLERVEAEKLSDVTIGEPLATTRKTVSELVADDIVGLYYADDYEPPKGGNTRYLGVENPLA